MLNWERGADQTGREGRVPSERSLAGPALRERILELVEALRPAAQAYLDAHPAVAAEAQDAHLREQLIGPAVAAYNAQARYQARETLPPAALAEVFARLRGFGPLAALMADPTISEIMVNGPDRPIYLERAGRLVPAGTADHPLTLTEEEIMLLLERMQAGSAPALSENNPLVEIRLPLARVNAMDRSLCPLQGPIMTIRLRSLVPLTATEIVARRMVSAPLLRFLALALQGGLNIVIAGDFGGGKTTLAQVLLSLQPRDMRLITIEDPIEWVLSHPNAVQMEVRGDALGTRTPVDARELVRQTVRYRPTIIAQGELRDAAALTLLEVARLAHGSLTTTHAEDAYEALTRVERLCLRAGDAPPLEVVQADIATRLHLVVIVERQVDPDDTVRRVVRSVHEVMGLNERGIYQMQELFGWDEAAGEARYRMAPSRRLVARAAGHRVALPQEREDGAAPVGAAAGGGGYADLLRALPWDRREGAP